jgi:hypothetical protein
MRCARVEGEGKGGDEGEPESRRVFIQSGKLGEIIPRLDDLTRRIAHYVKGGPVPAAGGGDGSGAGESSGGPEVRDLEERVEALERVVFSTAQSPEPAEGGAQQVEPSPGAEPEAE